MTHWQVYPRLDDHSRLLALLAALAAGVLFGAVVEWAGQRLPRRVRWRRPHPAPAVLAS
jgi:hypothetical protein